MNPYQGLKPSACLLPLLGLRQSSNQHESLSGIETCQYCSPAKSTRFQSTWIPIRDWNGTVVVQADDIRGSNQHESLSGIETTNIEYKWPWAPSGFQSTWIPIRDWNSTSAIRFAICGGGSNQHESLSGIETLRLMATQSLAERGKELQSTWIPIRDWNIIYWLKVNDRLKFQSTWIPIRDWNSSLSFQSANASGSNQHESLSGIETGYL